MFEADNEGSDDLPPQGEVNDGPSDQVSYSSEENQQRIYAIKLGILQSKLRFLKALKDSCKLSEEEKQSLSPLEEIGHDLNNTVTYAQLQELALTSIKDFTVFREFTGSESDTASPIDPLHRKVKKAMEFVHLEHTEIVSRLKTLIEERSQKQVKLFKKIVESKQELLKHKNMLNDQRQELEKKISNRKKEEVEKQKRLGEKVDKLNVSRMLIVNLLCISGVNLLEHPQWAKALVKARYPITIENIDSDSL